MGVKNLWRVVEPTGRRVPLEALSNQRLAIDTSIWLAQFMSAMRDADGEPLPNAHLLGMFRRICKLLFVRIKPVFVFDGATPALKRRTVAERARRRRAAESAVSVPAAQAARKLLKQQIASAAAKSAGAKAAGFTSRSGGTAGVAAPRSTQAASVDTESDEEDEEEDEEELQRALEALDVPMDLSALDMEVFKSLPPQLQRRVLRAMKRKRWINRAHRYERLQELAPTSDAFSLYQIDSLVNKHDITAKMQEANKALEKQVDVVLDHVDDDDLAPPAQTEQAGMASIDVGSHGVISVPAHKIMSDASQYYILAELPSSSTRG
ncbi:uncharacterized protein AMSG_03181 [Thecamonas trahens ATCC 50062]|uniref:XPG N-terminal domain-containing protein n=1 Tax=Thecamonas trahens ATCC 50062 TaxID=461836 RepID=A0A0L0D329_THETB|nr:hypothetical protein AMSG_03181 [Thecamonas trahens ATCC 50062]KNC46752.1 hypothetical protein AMSG_03181 [Thecamonas trahens ATCC 50062]|eukprot:XP_013760032.1 hypothetical protein AMSG_03181 [Thecamonas trahens ATCC 50062]